MTRAAPRCTCRMLKDYPCPVHSGTDYDLYPVAPAEPVTFDGPIPPPKALVEPMAQVETDVQEPKMTDAEATWAEMAVKKAVEGVGGFAAEMRQKGIHVGLGFGGSPGRCVTCAEPWPCSQMGKAEMDAAEAMNHIGRAVEEAMGESINSDPNGPRQPWLPLSVRYAAAEAAAKVVVEWRAGRSDVTDGNER